MEILLNELSLEGQYESKENFVSTALTPILEVMKEMTSFGKMILKSDEIFKSPITGEINLLELLKFPLSHHREETNRLKRLIDQLTKGPYWNDSTKQEDTIYLWNNENIWGSSLAESVERDQIVASFLNSRFEERDLQILKEQNEFTVDNITRKGDIPEILWKNSNISFGDYVRNRFTHGNLDFSRFINEDDFSNINQIEQNLFLNTFRRFNEMSWNQIIQDRGLNYKAFNSSIPGYSGDHSLDKFRASRLIRCHGYREKDKFYVLALETDHSLSDEG